MFSYGPRRTPGGSGTPGGSRTPAGRRPAVAVLCAALFGVAVPAAGAAEPAPPGPAAGQEARQAARFWTAQRMADARPLDAARQTPAAPGASAAAAARPKGTLFKGTRLVGTFFGSDGPGGTTWHCTGSVIDTKARNIVLTAAHCALNMKGDYVFVPKFVKGAAPDRQPYGIFHIQRVFIDPRYVPDRGSTTTKKAASDLDTAFARVSANQWGKSLQDAVGGGLTFTRPAGYNLRNVTVTGYPSYRHNSAGRAVKCTVPTRQLRGYRQLAMTCGGYYGGVSGSPWITDYKDDARTGHVIGNLGGYNGGGNDANVDYISYGTAFGADAANLLADAVADQAPPADLPPYRGLKGTLPGGAARWRGAALMASGDYTGDRHGDLLVVWSDGGVTLHPGDGKGGFGAEKRLRQANSTWTHARTVAGGTFTGDRSGLLVRWSDGEVTLYPQPGPSGLGREIRMAAPGSAWKNAVQFTAGAFRDGGGTGLLVRRTDGSLTLYAGIGAGGFGTGTRILPANGTWTRAALLTGGDFDGTAGGDLLVRWADGTLDTYAGTSAAGLGTRSRLRGPNGLWTHAQVLTAGDFRHDRTGNDLVVRWSDGETTLYADTGTKSLGTEHTLVHPGT
ncbi:trypsin-like serine peptidase [Streptomyces cinerochromogenes]|uniref:trypsin-like serine peptidase n=1 Tax=Streptomyces cinerochromogenes TaxID=66422 RepID=UPI00368C82EE